ncbi:LPS translocon maturation chaperone LptM [Lysobacter sp. F60174L2]|uniref:LPS translocon maturation chaperone LptM n=1 Tax=Lysobacter sp. F60174L2 TaxID=3459295 RepID=UPI00403E0953
MNARNPLLLAALVVSLPLAIAGCGNKGPLVMPDEAEPVEAPEVPAGTVPVEIDDPAADDIDVADPAAMPVEGDDIDATPEQGMSPGEPVPFDPIPIDPATVPDSPPGTGTADDGNG